MKIGKGTTGGSVLFQALQNEKSANVYRRFADKGKHAFLVVMDDMPEKAYTTVINGTHSREVKEVILECDTAGQPLQYRATTPVADTPLYSEPQAIKKGLLTFMLENNGGQRTGCIYPLSPTRRKKPITETSFFRKRTRSMQSSVIERNTKVEAGSVQYRATNRRQVNQNTVMGQSARYCVNAYIEQYKHKLTPETISKIQSLTPYEWGHIIAWSLSDINDDPQVASNLGVITYDVNTEMMVMERIAKLNATHHVDVNIKVKFKMVPGSNIAEKVTYTVELEHHGRRLQVTKVIDALENNHRKSRVSDQNLLQVVSAILTDRSFLEHGVREEPEFQPAEPLRPVAPELSYAESVKSNVSRQPF